MKSYHGIKPVTPQDKVMAKAHLNATKKLLLTKITDHQQAKNSTDNPKSKAYNQSHLVSHQKDLQEVNNSLNTLGDNMAFNTKKTGTFQGKSNAPGGGGRFAQMTAHGMSKGLAAFIGRKKYGAKKMASMAANGKKG